ncbi:MAG: RAMP superfamily CRISPR-associated protein [bacterium]|nr:RAMP superfamily CRISPR-associated protein [bacterium]
MKITLKTQSALLSASGESSAHLDADVKYDKHGFPYIQAKTFKGLLRESGLEVCEILGNDYEVVDELFGKTGNKDSGLLAFNNLCLKDYNVIEKELIRHHNILNKEFIKKFFTEIRQQTTIENGTAKDKSLRKYRLIKEGIEFETNIEIENVTQNQIGFLKNTLLNLRYIGTRRNRGFGKIEIKPSITQGISNSNSTIKSSSDPTNIDNPLAKLSFEITTMDTLLIAKIFGEQNTVSTEKHIPAQNIRGVIAGLIIKDRNLGKNAHKDDVFKAIILADKVKFNNAFIKGAQLVPKIYGYDKTDPYSKAEFIFEQQKPLKTMSGFVEFSNKEVKAVEVETIFSFHNSRSENRLAGRSTKDEGAIFYYEGIAPGQNFESELIGSKSDLKYIHSLLAQNQGIHRMGKSKTAQYSKVRFDQIKVDELKAEFIQKFKSPVYLVIQSPIITYNEFGMAIPDVSVLQNELATYIKKLKGISIASSSENIETYMGVWQSKTPRDMAFGIGTTLRIEFEDELDNGILAKIEMDGLGERKNEGYGRISVMNLKDGLDRKNNNNNSNAQVTVPLNPFTNSTLISIYDKQTYQEELNKLKLIAIENASHYYNKLPNSLISKLKESLTNATLKSDWDGFINNIKDKKAHKTLDAAKLWDNISKLEVPIDVKNSNSYLTQKLYWLSYFKALRVKQIKTNKNDR